MISQDKTTGRGEPTVTPCEKKKRKKKSTSRNPQVDDDVLSSGKNFSWSEYVCFAKAVDNSF